MRQGTCLNFKPGDIIVANVLFSSQVGAKLRPALVISNEKYNKSSWDLIVLKITSKGKDYAFDVNIKQSDLKQGTLKKESTIQADFPVVIEKDAAKKIAEVKPEVMSKVKKKIKTLLKL